MRTISASLQTACDTGQGVPIAKATLHPFNLPEIITSVGTVDACNAADSGDTYVIRVRKNGATVQYNRFARSAYATAANWNSWTTLQTEASDIQYVGIFIYTGASNPRTYIFWKHLGSTNLFYKYSTDEGATWSAVANLITTADTLNLVQGLHNAGFLHRNGTTNQLFLYAYKPSDGTFVTNAVTTPHSANTIISIGGTARTINVNGTDTDVITLAFTTEINGSTNDYSLWVGSATAFLTTPVWTGTEVIRSQTTGHYPGFIRAVFEDYICFSTSNYDILAKLVDYYGLTYGYLPASMDTAYPIAYDSTETKLLFSQGYYSTVQADIEYIVRNYSCTKETITCNIIGTTTPIDGILYVSRGYELQGVENYEPLTPYRVRSWRTNSDRSFTIEGATAMAALSGIPMPPGLQINTTRAQTYRLVFAIVGLSCTPNNESLINAQPYTNATPAVSSLSGAISGQSHAGAIELWTTEYGLTAKATQSTTSTQTITPDGGLLPQKNYSHLLGLMPTYLESGFNQINSPTGYGYPFVPHVGGFPYVPTTYDSLLETFQNEHKFMGTFGTRANLSLEIGDVITILNSDIRIININEIFGGTFAQQIVYRWNEEPLDLGEYGITPTQESGGSIPISPIQAHTHEWLGSADTVSIEDAGGYFTGTDVEAALQELGAGGGGGIGDGWQLVGWASPTRTGNYTFTVAVDITGTIAPGYKLKFTDTTTKYGTVYSVSYGAGVTTVTMITNSDYILVGNPSSISWSNIQSPYGFPQEWSYTATYGGTGSMTYTLVTTSYLKFRTDGRKVTVWFDLKGTTGGTASYAITLTTPCNCNAPAGALVYSTAYCNDGSAEAGYCRINISASAGKIEVLKPAEGNWALAANKYVRGSLSYMF